jgi:hypothetical protein
MPAPADPKEGAIYHTILSDLHRMQATLLNLRAIETNDAAPALREHFGREQTTVLARLNEWRQRRGDIYQRASADFAQQVGAGNGGSGTA